MNVVVRKDDHCKVMLVENGSPGLVRRIKSMNVQAANGRLYRLDGLRLPDSIVLYTGSPDEKKGTLEVLVGEPPAPSLRMLIVTFLNGTKPRDILFTLLGMLIVTVLITVADCILRIVG